MEAKKHIITIAGRPGSGKSTASKAVAAALDYGHFSSGGLFREISMIRHMNVNQANLDAEKGQSDIDEIVDKHLQDLGENENNLVIDSRTAWHWIPGSFKVYLNLDLSVAARRILADKDEKRRQDEIVPDSVDAYVEELRERLASETRRYRSLYDIDPNDLENYDLVVDTNANNPEQVKELITVKYREWLGAV
jgi:cytidylate kinase